jgi:hypothetical protein
MTHDERGAIAAGGANHVVAIGKRQRHRLFDDRVLAVIRRQEYMLAMHLVGRRDVDSVDVCPVDEFRRTGDGSANMIVREPFA